MRNAESWEPIVKALGFVDEKAMLTDLYIDSAMSIAEIAKRIGFSKGIIKQHLEAAGITLRERGGPNRRVTSRLADVPDVEFVDVHGLAERLGMHYSTVYKEARRRGICISALSLPPESLTDMEDVPLPNYVSRSTRTEVTPTAEHTLSGILEELEAETPSSSTTEPTSPQDGSPSDT